MSFEVSKWYRHSHLDEFLDSKQKVIDNWECLFVKLVEIANSSDKTTPKFYDNNLYNCTKTKESHTVESNKKKIEIPISGSDNEKVDNIKKTKSNTKLTQQIEKGSDFNLMDIALSRKQKQMKVRKLSKSFKDLLSGTEMQFNNKAHAEIFIAESIRRMSEIPSDRDTILKIEQKVDLTSNNESSFHPRKKELKHLTPELEGLF